VATKLLYRVPEAVEQTGIGRSTLYELMRSGDLESVKVGRSRLIPADALEEFVARLRAEGVASDAA
jgi:excisionase family DNA binding protein